MNFFVGLHQPSDAQHFERCMISIGRLVRRNPDGTLQRRPDGTLRARRAAINCRQVMMDSQAFQILRMYRDYPDPPAIYAELLRHLVTICGVSAASAEDYMCEPFVLANTGLTVADHQRLTIERYVDLMACEPPCYIMPVVQGYTVAEYVSHIRQYGDLLKFGALVGIGSVCKRNSDPQQIQFIIERITAERPDLQWHAFGLKETALKNRRIRKLLARADSMAWSFAERKAGRSANDWRAAKAFETRINSPDAPDHGPLFHAAA